MIDRVVSHLVGELNDYFSVRSQTPDRAEAASLFDLQGSLDPSKVNKVVMSLVNVQQDKTYRSVETFETRSDGTAERVQPPVMVNLYLLFIANFSDYDEAMKAIAQVMSFFQHRPTFPYASIPALAALEGRLSVELTSMSLEQVNHLWGALGSKYMPSVLYKVGLFDLRDRQVEAEVAPIEEIMTTVEGV